jgi:hypothetical protein
VSLRDLAAADAKAIIEDDVGGFATTVTLTSPDNETAEVKATVADIGQSIDPNTGLAVSGRKATAAFSKATLLQLGFDIRGTSDGARRPWVVVYTDVVGCERNYKVNEVLPDSELGITVCILESYR